MTIKVNDVPCLTAYEDAQRELDRFGFLWDFVWAPRPGALHYGSQPPPVAWWRQAPAAAPIHARQCRPPRWILNSLWLPTGASRYGIALLLADGERVQTIMRTTPESGEVSLSVSAKMAGGDVASVTSQTWYLLPPVALNAPAFAAGAGSSSDLFVVPLVDARFFWQFRAITFTSSPESWTWDEAQGAVDDAISGKGSIDWGNNLFSAYRPDWFALGAKSTSAGLFADAIAASTGRRIVPPVSGNAYAAKSLDESVAEDEDRKAAKKPLIGQPHRSQLLTMADQRAGLQSTLPPKTVKVWFDRRQGGYHEQRGHQRVETVDMTTALAAAVPEGMADNRKFGDWTMEIYTTAQADYSSAAADAGGGGWDDPGLEPDNAASVTELAELIAAVTVGWGLETWDFTTIPDTVTECMPSARDDYRWFIIDMPTKCASTLDFNHGEPLDMFGEVISFVRAKSLNWHDLPTQQCQQFAPGAAPLSRMATGLARVELTAALSRGGHAKANIFYFDEDADEWDKDARQEVTVYDSLERYTGSAGDRFWVAALPHDSGRFEIVAPSTDALLAYGQLVGDLCEDGAATLTAVHRYPDCTALPLVTSASNPRKHAGFDGAKVVIVRRDCIDAGSSGSGSAPAGEVWEILDVQLRTGCAVMKVEDRGTCLTSAHHKFRAEWTSADDPLTVCQITPINPCSTGSSGSGSSGAEGAGGSSGSGGCDLSWTSVGFVCCGDYTVCGSGSGSSGGGA